MNKVTWSQACTLTLHWSLCCFPNFLSYRAGTAQASLVWLQARKLSLDWTFHGWCLWKRVVWLWVWGLAFSASCFLQASTHRDVAMPRAEPGRTLPSAWVVMEAPTGAFSNRMSAIHPCLIFFLGKMEGPVILFQGIAVPVVWPCHQWGTSQWFADWFLEEGKKYHYVNSVCWLWDLSLITASEILPPKKEAFQNPRAVIFLDLFWSRERACVESEFRRSCWQTLARPR